MTPKQILAFALGPIGAAALGLVTVPLLTWFFSPEDIGRITMLQIAITFCLLLLGLGLDQAYVREYYDAENKPKLLFNALMPGLLFLFIALAPFFILPNQLSLFLFNIDSSLVGWLVVLILFGALISRFLSLLLRMQERGMAFSLSQILPKIVLIMVVLFYMAFPLDSSFINLIFAHFISINLILLILMFNTRIEWQLAVKESIDKEMLKRMLIFSTPLIVSGVAYWGLTTADKIFIRHLSSFEELGIYSVAVSFAAVATVFQGIFGLLWSPWVYKALAANQLDSEAIYQAQRKTIFIATIIFSVMGMFSWVIDWFLPDAYSNVKYIVVACVGLPIYYTISEVTGIGVGITKRTFLFMQANIFSLILSLALNYLLVPIYGASGAAVSTCVSLWLFYLLKTEISNFVWHRFSRVNAYAMPVLCLLASVLMALRVVSDIFVHFIWIAVFTINMIVYRSDFIDILKFIRSLILRKANSTLKCNSLS